MILLHKLGVVRSMEKKKQAHVFASFTSRLNASFASALRRRLFLLPSDVTGEISLLEGTEMVMPGDNATLKVARHLHD